MSGPECSVCGVPYAAEYAGPCQEPRGRWLEREGRWSGRCPGAVSWDATVARLERRIASADRELAGVALPDGEAAGRCVRALEALRGAGEGVS